ncbi:MAG TPA: PhoU domain-containing protein [Ktedonobacteraceae bacterium]|nr:PhoU domain-containing protein [Ktedonobacteraceae bacterium]
MARTTLETQLQQIRAKIVALGSLVETALKQALQAVQSGDQALCGLVIAGDNAIDTIRSEIERLAFQSLTLQQPLIETDIRFLSFAPAMGGDLERMGDNAAGIAKLLLRIVPLRLRETNQESGDHLKCIQHHKTGRIDQHVTEASIVTGLVELGQEAQRVLQGTLHAFVQNDTQAARVIWQEDDVVDVRYHLVRHDIMTMLTDIHAIPALRQDALAMQRMTYWLWIAHNLERISDHCTNICERIVFFLEGEGNIQPKEPI